MVTQNKSFDEHDEHEDLPRKLHKLFLIATDEEKSEIEAACHALHATNEFLSLVNIANKIIAKYEGGDQ